MILRDIREKIVEQYNPETDDMASVQKGALIAYTHQQSAFNEWSEAARTAYEELDARYQEAMECLFAKWVVCEVSRGFSDVSTKEAIDKGFNDYKKQHGLI